MRSFIGWFFAGGYFVFFMIPVLILLIFTPIMFISEVNSIRSSGFPGHSAQSAIIGIVGFFTGLSLLIPPLRRMYRLLPWLYPFVQIMFVNLVIINIGHLILNYGYEEIDETRHSLFFTLMIAQLIVCRLAMCVYYKFKPINFGEKRAVRG